MHCHATARLTRSFACLALVLAAAAVPAFAGNSRRRSAAEMGMELFIPPTFVRGQAIQPGELPEVPVLLVFAHPESPAARAAVKKMDAACAKFTAQSPRVVLVASALGSLDARKLMAGWGLQHVEVLADPLQVVRIQCGVGVNNEVPLQLRSLSPSGKVATQVDFDLFVRNPDPEVKAALKAAAKDSAKEPAKESAKEPAKESVKEVTAESRSPKLKEAYAYLDAGKQALALSKFRLFSDDRSGKDPATVTEAQAMVSKLDEGLDSHLRELRASLSDQYVADLEEARQTLLPAWKEDAKSKSKVERFIEDWSKKDEVKNEYSARKMRLTVWRAMGAAKPDRKQIHKGFDDLAKKYFNTPTGVQAATMAKLLK